VVVAAVLVTQVLGAVLAVPLLALFPGDLDQGALSSPYALFLLVLLGDLGFVGIVWLLLVRRGLSSPRDMGLVGRGALPAALRGLLWGILFIAVSGVIQLLLALLGVTSDQAAQFPLQESSTAGRVVVWIAGVVLAPLAEEIFFRGYVFRAMSARKGYARGLVYSSMLFGLVHFNLAAFLPLTVGAMLLAVSYRRSGSLWTPIVAHALNNAFAFTLLTFFPGAS
jgi:membrane protease YdiL (CAAX protease family)